MTRFYRCNICGNLIHMVEDSGVNPVCCNHMMEELHPKTDEFANEKHVPVFTETRLLKRPEFILKEDSGKETVPSYKKEYRMITVTVGSTPHPMLPEHYISFLLLVTTKGTYMKPLNGKEHAISCFLLDDCEKIKEIYAYCNIHGLWINRVNEP